MPPELAGKRLIRRIFIHCSDTPEGDVDSIRKYHIGQGWKDIGYHYVVLKNGVIEAGRPEEEGGAHVQGENYDSLGVCLIGKDGLYTVVQLRSAVYLVNELLNKYKLSWPSVYGHYQAPSAKVQGKSCPDFDISFFRSLLRRD